MPISQELRRLKQLGGLIGIFGYHNLFRRTGSWLDREGVLCHRVSQLASRRALRFLDLEVRTEGLEHVRCLENYCVVSNHASYLDWALLLAHFPSPLRFIAKRELAAMPIIGAFLRDRGVLIDRARGIDARSAIRAAVHDGQPHPLMIFPEGTRTPDGEIKPFKRGGLRILADAGRSFVPVCLRGTYEVLPRHGRCVSVSPGMQLELRVAQPLHPYDYRSNEDMISACERRVHQLYRGEGNGQAVDVPPDARTPAELRAGQPRAADNTAYLEHGGPSA